jgi:hypothetical protein
MAFHYQRGRLPLCPSIVARDMATLLMADLHPVGGQEIWSGNQISISISSRISIHLDEDGCSLEVQPFSQATNLLLKLAPLWGHGIHNLTEILCRSPDGHPCFLEERELQWANPSQQFFLPEALAQALKYLRVLLSSTDPAHSLSLCQKLTGPHGLDYSIAPPMADHTQPRLGLHPLQILSSCCRQNNQATLHREINLTTGRHCRGCQRLTTRPHHVVLPHKGKNGGPAPASNRQTSAHHHHRTPPV